MLGRILGAFLPRRRAAEAADPLRLARSHVHSSEFAEAEALYRAFVRDHPDDTVARLEFALTLDALGRRFEAAQVSMDAWARDSGDAEIARHAMRLFDALTAADVPAEGVPANDFVAEFARANSELAAGDFDAARARLTRCRALNPDWPFTRQRLGCIDAFAGRLADATAHFSASGAYGLPPDAYIDLDTGFLDALDHADTGAPAASADASPAAVVVIACDPIYFRRFAYPLLQSIRENAGVPLIVHLHVFNPDPWIDEEIGALPTGGNLLRIDVSQEVRAFASKDAAKTYFSCARVFLVPELIARHRRPVIMLDVDILVLQSLGPLLGLVLDRDIALLRWPRSNWRIWDHVSASTVVFGTSAGAARFAGMIAGYVRNFVARPDGAWYLDQIALFAAMAHLQTRGVCFVDIPARWYALFDRDGDAPPADAVFWSVTANIPDNARALTSTLMRRFQPETRRAFGWTMPGSDTFFPAVLAQAPTENGKRRWEHELMRQCVARARSHRRAVDVGAHVGFWSEWLADRFAHVEAFEPHPLMQACFRRNARVGNVVLHSCGLGDADADAFITYEAANSGMSRIASEGGDGVRIRRLDDFNFADVDFVKIDVEGYETRVLRGAEQTLRRCKPLVLVEQVDANLERYGATPGAATELMIEFGARLIVEYSDHNYLFDWPD